MDDKAFEKNQIANLFQKEKNELDKTDEGSLYRDGYPNYLNRVDTLIEEKLK